MHSNGTSQDDVPLFALTREQHNMRCLAMEQRKDESVFGFCKRKLRIIKAEHLAWSAPLFKDQGLYFMMPRIVVDTSTLLSAACTYYGRIS